MDEEALYEALKERKIFAAGLDVFEKEPISSDHPLLQLDNVTAQPHIGSATIDARVKMVNVALENIIEGLKGEQIPYIVNKELYT